jgi:F420-non-reducing hydrogenase iron-sulfur subunit
MEGNYKTARRIPLLKKMLKQLGIEEERVRLEWVSAAEGARFATLVKDMIAKVKELGPSRREGGFDE